MILFIFCLLAKGLGGSALENLHSSHFLNPLPTNQKNIIPDPFLLLLSLFSGINPIFLEHLSIKMLGNSNQIGKQNWPERLTFFPPSLVVNLPFQILYYNAHLGYHFKN